MKFYDDRPIIACASGTHEHSALAVIRLSGFTDFKGLSQFFSLNLQEIKPRVAHYTKIKKGADILDEGILIYYQGPSSFNGENILEISVHGNPNNVERMIRVFVDEGVCRRANPGEFTYRAVLNKKLSLSQAEGLNLLINARSAIVFNQGLSILHGQLHQHYLRLRDSYLKLRATVEIFFDFLEDIGEQQAQLQWQQAKDNFSYQISQLYNKTQKDWRAITTPTVLILGQTNAGKSSLFNFLLKEHRAIVSPEAGTTRDFISEYLTYKGVEIKLVDTAGFRNTDTFVEKEGIRRAQELISTAFYKIFVVNPFQTNSNDLKEIERVAFDLCAVTHDDLDNCQRKFQELSSKIKFKKLKFVNLSREAGPIEPMGLGPIGPRDQRGPIGPNGHGPIGPVRVEEILDDIYGQYQLIAQETPILIGRHREIIDKVYQEFVQINQKWGNEEIAIIDFEIQQIGNKIEELIGIVTPENVLDSIFKEFCIGK
jgi:tRNA modification GTPase